MGIVHHRRTSFWQGLGLLGCLTLALPAHGADWGDLVIVLTQPDDVDRAPGEQLGPIEVAVHNVSGATVNYNLGGKLKRVGSGPQRSEPTYLNQTLGAGGSTAYSFSVTIPAYFPVDDYRFTMLAKDAGANNLLAARRFHVGVGPQEVCDGVDNDGDGMVDESLNDDDDGDGWTPCDGDCDDADADVHPYAWDEPGDGVDTNCNGLSASMPYDMSTVYTAEMEGEAAYNAAGYCVSGDGDINGDGITDILIGANQELNGPDPGYAYVLYGPVSGSFDLSSADARYVGEDQYDDAGRAVAIVGDVNADGYDDILVGAPYHDDPALSSGSAYLVYGPAYGWNDLSSADAKFTGEDSGDQAGDGVAGVGDINSDGYDDILIGAQMQSDNGYWTGTVYLMHGPIYGTIGLGMADAILRGDAYHEHAGETATAAGDLNADGVPDILISAQPCFYCGGTLPGTAYVVYGPVSGTMDLYNADAKLWCDGCAYGHESVSAAGDVNGDGYDDVLVGAIGDDANGMEAGAAFLVHGPVSGVIDLANEYDAKLLGQAYRDRAGVVSDAGDINGDGFDDFMVGAYQRPYIANAMPEGAGMAYVVLGPVSGLLELSGANIKIAGDAYGDSIGWSLDGVQDMDGDGLDDLLLGTPHAGDSCRGTSYLISASEWF